MVGAGGIEPLTTEGLSLQLKEASLLRSSPVNFVAGWYEDRKAASGATRAAFKIL